MNAQVPMPKALRPVFQGQARYRCAYGGRGSGKSRNFAMMLALKGYERRLRILCCREIQNSIRDSSMHEIERAIESVPFLDAHYTVLKSSIIGANGTEFLFKGLYRNQQSITSTAAIDICWVEEAESVSDQSWKLLRPTIREPGSEIWVTWNPERPDAPCQRMFIDGGEDGLKRVVKVNWMDNPWFPPELEYERQDCLKNDIDNYDHIWMGECQTRTDAQVFNGKWSVAEFKPDPKKWNGPYYGLDFGFSQDPTACVQCWEYGDDLYIHREAGQTKLELDDTARFLIREMKQIDRYPVRCDSARPESISYLKRKGLPLARPVFKWPNSIVEGVAWLRSHRQIIIHPRCKETAREFRLYHYKVDRATGEPSSIIVDAHNHYIDAIRYAYQPLIKKGMVDYDALSR